MANYGAWRVTYTEGRWAVLSGPSSMVVLQPAPAGASQLIDEVWEVVLEAESIASLAAALARFGLDRMPNMAVLFHADGILKALLRGEVELRDGTTGKVLASGEGADTWFEVTSPSPRVFLHLDDVEPNDMLQLPLVVGVAQASAVLVDVANPIPVSTSAPSAGQDAQVAPTPPPVTGVNESSADEPDGLARGVEDSVSLYDASSPGSTSPATAGGMGAGPEAKEPQAAGPLSAVDAGAPQLGSEEDLPIVEEDVTEAFAFAPEDIQNLTGNALQAAASGEAAKDEAHIDAAESPIEAAGEPVEQPAEWDEMPGQAPADPELVAAAEHHSDDERAHDAELSQPVIPEGSGMEVTEVLDDVPPYAPGQEPIAQAESQSFGTQFGNSATGTTGPFGAEGFGHLIPASASDGPVQFYDQEISAPIPQPEPSTPAAQPEPSVPDESVPLDEQPEPSIPLGQMESLAGIEQPEPPAPVPQPEPPAPVAQPEPPAPEPQPEPPAPSPAPQMVAADATTQQQATSQYSPMPTPAPFADPAALQGHPVDPSFGPRPTMPAPGPRVVSPVTDHDGATVFTTGIAATHKPAMTRTEESAVLASVCSLGHPNRPGTHTCRICGGIVDANNPQLVNRPVLATVVTTLGDQVRLTAPVIIGRAPSNQGTDLDAELLRVPSPNHDISRNHVRIAPREWAIEVTDLHSTNGTVVQQVGGEAYRLNPGQTVILEIGDVIDLGDGQVLTLAVP